MVLLPLPGVAAMAFCALLEHVPVDRLPTHGGTPTSVVVMLDWESLLQRHGIAALSTGGRMSAAEVRRLACTAGVLPGGARWRG